MMSNDRMVMLPGWGFHTDVWRQLRAHLSDEYDVQTLALPLHNTSPEHMTATLVGQAPDNAWWLGWSLGGELALQVALDHPKKVAGLILIGTTPRFIDATDWPWGMPEDLFNTFVDRLTRDPRRTRQRFCALCAGNRDVDGRTAAALESSLLPTATDDLQELLCGLSVLHDTDLRGHVNRIVQPVLQLHGRHDEVVNLAAAQWLNQELPRAQLRIMEQSGHAPFVDAPEDCADAIQDFIRHA